MASDIQILTAECGEAVLIAAFRNELSTIQTELVCRYEGLFLNALDFLAITLDQHLRGKA